MKSVLVVEPLFKQVDMSEFRLGIKIETISNATPVEPVFPLGTVALTNKDFAILQYPSVITIPVVKY